jgi:hypothetical protein
VLLSQHTETATLSGVAFPGTAIHDAFASFPGDSNYASSQSTTVPLNDQGLTTTTTALNASPNPALPAQTVTLTATISPTPTGSPLGTVSFYDGATLIGTGTVNSSGVATLTTSTLSSGSHSLTAAYSGNSLFGTSTSSPVTENVNLNSTTTALAAVPKPALAGQTVTLTATISPTPTGSPLGTVSFYDGATLIGTASVNSSGVATLTTSTLSTGSHSLTAAYSGNSLFATSTSSPASETVNLNSTTTALSPSPNPALAGQTVTLTATISPTPTGSPLGTVSFYDGATLIGTSSVNSSDVATLTTSTLSTGSHSLTAAYSGNSLFATSTSSPASETINLNSTTMALSPSPNPALAGQTVTLTATISPTPTGSQLGTVSFYNGSTLIGTASVNSSGVATLTTSALPAGTDALTAVYSGNSGFAGSTSSSLNETVNLNPTTTSLAAAPNPSTVGQVVVFTATVSPIPTGSPRGTVNFFSGLTLLGSGNVNSSGVATFSISNLAAGPYTITATYSGNAGFASSTSSGADLVVDGSAVYTIAASPDPFTVNAGSSIAIQVTVPPLGGPYNSLVTMSATGLPPGANAVFAPSAVTPGSAGATTTMTIHTTRQSADLGAAGNRFLLGFGLAVGMVFAAGSRKRAGHTVSMLIGLLTLTAATITLSGCGGGWTGAGSGVQSHTYVITVTGTSGPLHPSTTVTLIVKE